MSLKDRLAAYKRRLAVITHYQGKAEGMTDPARQRRWLRVLKGMEAGARKGIRVTRRKLKAQTAVKSVWHPDATRVPYSSAGRFAGGGKKIVWHTTEGSSLPAYSGSQPHFTLDPRTGQLWQHQPIDEAAKTLKAGGPNFWNTIQVELIGFAKDTQDWPDEHYDRIAALARWIEHNGDVPRKCTVEFFRGVPRLSSTAFYDYRGHIGHCHAPLPNDHWDPGALRIDKILRRR